MSAATAIVHAPAGGALLPGRAFPVPEGVTPRGSVLVLPGRGEHPGVYERFGRRLSADGYAVLAPEEPANLAGPVFGGVQPVAPVVLAGFDTGALWALRLVASGALRFPVAGVVLAGLPAGAPPARPVRAAGDGWASELDERTACPAHRDRLSRDTRLLRGALARPVPADLAAVLDRPPAVPALLIHGDADAVASIAAARAFARGRAGTEFVTVPGGRHDVLNDLAHRSVAAHLVLWLERLRGGVRLHADVPSKGEEPQ